MVAKRHKITNVPMFKKLWDIIFFGGDNHFMSHFSGHFEGASTFLTPKLSLEMAHKVIVPQKKIMSRSFLNSGTLIVKIYFLVSKSSTHTGLVCVKNWARNISSLGLRKTKGNKKIFKLGQTRPNIFF